MISCVLFLQLMAVTLLGSACMNALALVVEELNTLFVIATIPGQHTEGRIARDLDQLRKAKVVTHRNVQVNFYSAGEIFIKASQYTSRSAKYTQ